MTDFETLSELPEHIQSSARARLGAVDRLRAGMKGMQNAEESETDQQLDYGFGGRVILQAVQQKAEIPDNAVNIQDRSEAPEGAEIIEGDRGGLYYIPENGESDTRNESDEVVNNIVESVDISDTVESQRGHPRLTDEQIDSFNETLEDEIGFIEARKFNERLSSWKSNSYTDEAQTHEKAFSEALGLEGDVRNGELNGADPTEEQVIAAEAYAELSKRFMRENFGDEVNVERGLADFGMGQLIATWANNPDEDDIEFNLSAMSNFSTDDSVSERFAERYQTAKLSKSISADDVIAATDFLNANPTSDEAELSVKGANTSVDKSDIEFAVSGDTLPDDIESMDETMARRIESFIQQQSENMTDVLTDEGRQTLFELKEEFDLLHPTEDEL